MGYMDMIRTMKQVHPDEIILLKMGKFYYAYGKDAYIIAFMFNYQVKKAESNLCSVGFPEVALNKIEKGLEDKNVSYRCIDKSNNYEVLEEESFKHENKYNDMYAVARKFQTRKSKIDEIYKYLLANIEDECIKGQIKSIEEILYEW